jgi:hypoxanthine-guanine phosphoribosyltransferase
MKKLEAYQPVYSAEEIAKNVNRLAKEISSWAEIVWQQSHTELLTIPILRGALSPLKVIFFLKSSAATLIIYAYIHVYDLD